MNFSATPDDNDRWMVELTTQFLGRLTVVRSHDYLSS